MEDLRYPLGKYIIQQFDQVRLKKRLDEIKILPTLLENAILNLDDKQLDTPYREDGWTVKQVVHHVADSHMNAYIRFKLGLTEDDPVIKTYNEVA